MGSILRFWMFKIDTSVSEIPRNMDCLSQKAVCWSSQIMHFRSRWYVGGDWSNISITTTIRPNLYQTLISTITFTSSVLILLDNTTYNKANLNDVKTCKMLCITLPSKSTYSLKAKKETAYITSRISFHYRLIWRQETSNFLVNLIITNVTEKIKTWGKIKITALMSHAGKKVSPIYSGIPTKHN